MSTDQTSDAVKRFDKLYEFDRVPVTEDRLLGPGYFAGSFSGEHVAATEFVIGVLFVNWGASITDIFLGLAVGNVLAVLTWTLLCAPIGVKTRLTLYWYLRKIGGPDVPIIYNILNAVLFCILAGCMITVSASAVRIPFSIPAQTNWYPDDPRFVLVVFGVGAVVVTLAILGFKKLAGFATVCSPWMFLMFIAGAVVMIPPLARSAGVGEVNSFASFWEMGRTSIWTGTLPAGSDLTEPMGFWKVAAFAWICNLAMHGGLSDMALFRYARKASYGLFSAFGMFLGHYLAWIAAGMMGAGVALALNTPLTELDAGEVGYQALGLCGAIAVIIAGWTTSNPTLYRAGLAFQAVTPNWSRAKVTLVTGVVTTVIACFPFVFTELLNFVGIYGLLLVPIGAIVITEHWIFPRIGLPQYWSSTRKLQLNWPAIVSWGLAIIFALILEYTETLHLFFLFIPVFFMTAALYIMFSTLALSFGGAPQKEESGAAAGEETSPPPQLPEREPAKANRVLLLVTGTIALAGLITCAVMPFVVFSTGTANYAANLETFKSWLIVPTVLYFVCGTIFHAHRQATKKR